MKITLPLVLAVILLNFHSGLAGETIKAVSNYSDEVFDLLIAFNDLDLDGNRALSFGEFTANVRAIPGSLRRTFRLVDSNRNRSVSIREFAQFRGVKLPEKFEHSADAVKREFRNLDFDDNWLITIEEIGIATTFSSGEALEAYFENLDADASGGIDLQEYRAGRTP